jgi:lysophospholipase L1-like esterase
VHTSALRNLWSPRTARRRGLVGRDDIHPTAAGYRRMARVLAPILARLVRQEAAG